MGQHCDTSDPLDLPYCIGNMDVELGDVARAQVFIERLLYASGIPSLHEDLGDMGAAQGSKGMRLDFSIGYPLSFPIR